MPAYQYQCECGVQFQGIGPASKHSEPRKCPDCGELAQRMMPATVSGQFNQRVTGPVPQNTGVANIDAVADRAIGLSAKQGYEVINERVRLKREMLRLNPGREGRDISFTGDQETPYGFLTPDERGVHERANKINHLAMNALKPVTRRTPKAPD